jgi:hypothetical protein
MTQPELIRRLPTRTLAQLHELRRRYRLYPAWIALIEQEAQVREMESRPQGPTTTLILPSKLNSSP